MNKYSKFLFLFALTAHSVSVFSMSRAVFGRRLLSAVAVASVAKVGMSQSGWWSPKYTREDRFQFPVKKEFYFVGSARNLTIKNSDQNNIVVNATI